MAQINTWPGWECVRKLGSGSYGTVYEIRCIEANTEWHSALKVITIPQNDSELQVAYSEGMSEDNVTGYFKAIVEDISKEFRLMQSMSGLTNIVSCEGFKVIPHEDEIGWDILIRMELLTSLLDYTKSQPLTERQIIQLGLDLCSALKICEKRGIVHRDIKPENIFVNSDGDFKLGDFGIARTIERTATMSQKGTYTYMAPEVYNGKEYGLTVDIYSLGMVLYWFLNENRVPFLPLPPAGLLPQDRNEALRRRISGEPIPAPLHGSERLKQAVLKALSYDPSDRFRNAQEFADELRRCEMELIDEDDAAETVVEHKPKPELQPETQYERTVMPGEVVTGTNVSGENAQNSSETHDDAGGTVTPEAYGREGDDTEPSDKTAAIPQPLGGDSRKNRELTPRKSKLPVILAAAAGVVVLIGILCAVLFLRGKDDSGANVVESKSGSVTESTDVESSTSSEDNVTALTLNQTAVELTVGESIELTANIETSSGAFTGTVKWVTSSEAIATVESTGALTATVTCVGQGNCYVTASVENYSKSCDFSCTAQSEATESSSVTIDGEVSAYAKSDIILQGDSVKCILKVGDWLLESASGAEWYSEDESIATINEDGYVTGISPGTATLGVNYDGSNATFEILVVAVDGDSNASITADYELLGLQSYAESTINLTLDGVEEFGATVYSNNFNLTASFGELDGNTVPLTITSLGLDEGEYWVTVLLYDSDDKSHVLAAKRIQIDVN